MLRVLWTVVACAAYAVVGFHMILLLFVGVGWANASGPAFAIASGSMTPAVPEGSIVIHDRFDGVEGRPVKIHDIITFRSSGAPHHFTTHRVVDVEDQRFITKGDANQNRDSEPVEGERIVGRVVTVIPAIGKPMIWAINGNWIPFIGWLATSTVAVAFPIADIRRLVRRMHSVRHRPTPGLTNGSETTNPASRTVDESTRVGIDTRTGDPRPLAIVGEPDRPGHPGTRRGHRSPNRAENVPRGAIPSLDTVSATTSTVGLHESMFRSASHTRRPTTPDSDDRYGDTDADFEAKLEQWIAAGPPEGHQSQTHRLRLPGRSAERGDCDDWFDFPDCWEPDISSTNTIDEHHPR